MYLNTKISYLKALQSVIWGILHNTSWTYPYTEILVNKLEFNIELS